MGRSKEIDGMVGSGSAGSPGSDTVGMASDGSNDGIGIATSNAMLGIVGSDSDGSPGSDAVGSCMAGSNDGIGIATSKEIDGIVGSDSAGSPGMVSDGKLHALTRRARALSLDLRQEVRPSPQGGSGPWLRSALGEPPRLTTTRQQPCPLLRSLGQ